jgi:alkylated DNA repair dioxygenase AlkB
MSLALQASLLDDLGESAPPRLGPLRDDVDRSVLRHGAWVDLRPGWVTGADALFERLVAEVPWYAERRQMYDRVVDVPRLLCFYGEDDPLPEPLLAQAREALCSHYADELGERIGRGRTEDTMVAIVSLGTPRRLLLRPRGGGGPGLRFTLGHGDLLVMGGSCQRTWEHCVPKTSRPVGPRISVQFRPRGVR